MHIITDEEIKRDEAKQTTENKDKVEVAPIVKEKIQLTIIDNLDFEKECLEVIRLKETPTFSGYGTRPYSHDRGSSYNENYQTHTIYFYENGTTKNTSARIWKNPEMFFAWADEQGIMISTAMKSTIRGVSVSFCACKKGQVVLTHRTTFLGLESALGESKETSVGPSSYPNYPYNMDAYDDEYWDSNWD